MALGPATVTISPTSLPSGFCPASEQERLDEYAKRLRGYLPAAYSTVVIGSARPSATDQDKPWLRYNTDGTFDRVYTFANGLWRSEHPIKQKVVTIWIGNLADIETLDGGTAGTATPTTGPFWKELQGMRGRFPLGVGTLPSGTSIAVGTTGGEERHTLTTSEIPDHAHNIAGSTTSIIYGAGNLATTVYKPDPSTSSFSTQTDGGGDISHNNMPPYYGVYFIYRTSRLYYTVS